MAKPTVAEVAARLGLKFFDYQLEFFDAFRAGQGLAGACLYYKTGAGKSITSLAAMVLYGLDEVLVIAPPITHPAWEALGTQLGIRVTAISHAKFRMKDFKVSRTTAVIADEFHLFGGYNGQGWKKLERLVRGLQAPLIICSATPNYNDAERCYCVEKLISPHTTKGGYLDFIYRHCNTEQNPFGRMPIVTGFRNYKNAEDYLASLPYVFYVPDDVTYTIVDIPIASNLPDEFTTYNLHRREMKLMASQMEIKWQSMYVSIVTEEGFIRDDILDVLTELVGQATTGVMMYCDSARVAEALAKSCDLLGTSYGLITGKTTPREKDAIFNAFKRGDLDVLVGTASLATGADGLDKVCDTMVIVNDTRDASLRRQLLGRILPRGTDSDASRKQFFRLVLV